MAPWTARRSTKMRIIPFLTPDAQVYDLGPVYRQIEDVADADHYAEGGVIVAGNLIRLSARFCDQRDHHAVLAVNREYDRRVDDWPTIVADFSSAVRSRGIVPR